MYKKIKALILSQDFSPSLLGIWTNPFYLARKGLWDEIKNLAPRFYGRVLDVGCGTKPYHSLFKNVAQYDGIEIDNPYNRKFKQADFFYDGGEFPILSEIYDGVVCNQVLEHVFNPNQFLSEINRILKKDGMLLLTVPFVWDEHEQPWDYARYSSFGLKSLLKENGLEIIVHHKTNADARVLFQLINAYLFKILMTSNGKLNMLSNALLIAPFTLLGIVFGKVLPSNADLYLDQVVLARKIKDE